jgi:hypothetical protein
VDQLRRFQGVDGCSPVASGGDGDRGVERLADQAFRCVLRPATWRRVSALLEPFEQTGEPNGFRLPDGGGFDRVDHSRARTSRYATQRIAAGLYSIGAPGR